MTRSLITCCALATTLVLSAVPSQAQWCASYQHGGSNCYFTSQAQCQAAISGVGGACTPTQVERPATTQPTARPRPPASRTASPEKTEPRRKETPRRVEQPARSAPAAAPSAPAVAVPPAAGSMPANFATARQLVFDGQYAAGIAAMHALGLDDHPEIATYIGFSHSKLGRIDQARSWYDKALAANPNHLLTLSFYGILHVNRGDLGQARDNLEKLRRLCGTDCNEFKALEAVLAAKTR